MELREVMEKRTFVVVGDTLTEGKYAYRIKTGLLEKGYSVFAVGKELSSINAIDSEIDIIDLCINPVKGLELISECLKPFKCIVIQPGAESDELITYLQENQLPYIQACLLVGMKLYTN